MFSWLRNVFAGNPEGLATGHPTHRNPSRTTARRRTTLLCEPLEDRMLLSSSLIVGPNVNVSKTSASEQENSIVINPTNPKNLFAASTSGGISGGQGFAYSLDGGTTWLSSDVSALPASAGDQQMAWDTFGNLFLTELTTSSGSVETIVALSINGGASFSVLLNTNSFGDQPSIAVGAGTVWFNYNVSGPQEAQGAQVTGLGAIGAFSASQQPGGAAGVFGDIAIGPNGQVMMVYQEAGTNDSPSNVFFSLDPDGRGAAQGFSASSVIYRSNVGDFDAIPAQPNRTIDAEVNLAWDRSNGPHRGRVYLVATDERVDESNDTDIFVRFSDDNGTTWSTPVRVNDDTSGNGKSQFNPAIAVDQTTGNVAVTWYDCRNSAGNNTAQVFGTVSRDGGVTWETNVQISVGTTDATVAAAGGFDFGDYDKMDFHAGVFYRAWADNSNSTGDNPAGSNDALDLYTAMVTVPTLTNGTGNGGGTGGAVRLFNPVRFKRQKLSQFYHGLMTIVNYTSSAVTGPIYVIFDKLPAGVRVINASGITADGKPFIKLNRNLNPRKSSTFTVRIANPLQSKLETFFRTKQLKFSTINPS